MFEWLGKMYPGLGIKVGKKGLFHNSHRRLAESELFFSV